MYFPITREDSKYARIFLSDKFHYILAHLTEEAIEEFSNTCKNRSLPSLKGSLITVDKYKVEKQNDEHVLIVEKFIHVGADNCPTHGDPENVAKFLEDSSSMDKIDELFRSCEEEESFPNVIRDIDCVIDAKQESLLSLSLEVRFSPIKIPSINPLESDDSDSLSIVDDDGIGTQYQSQNYPETQEITSRASSLSEENISSENMIEYLKKSVSEEENYSSENKIEHPKRKSPECVDYFLNFNRTSKIKLGEW